MNLCYHFHVRHSCRFGARCRFVHEFRFDPAKTYYMTHRPITSAYARTLDPKFEMRSWVLAINCLVVSREHDGYCSEGGDIVESEKYVTLRTVPEVGVADVTVANRYIKGRGEFGWCGCGIIYYILNIERFMGFPKSFWKGPSDQVLALEPILCADLLRRVFDLIPQ